MSLFAGSSFNRRLFSGEQLIFALTGMLAPVAVIGLLIGPTPVTFSSIFYPEQHPLDWTIISEIRLPRLLLTAMIGSVLATSGAVLQGLFRNPLADPSLIGVTAGASVGASFSILIGASLIGSTFLGSALGGLTLTAAGAFLGGIVAVWMVYRLSTGPSGTSVSTMLLVGIAVTVFGGALNNLMSFVADNEMLRRMSLWQMGNLDLANWHRVQLCAVMMIFFVALLHNQAQSLNILLLGESEARHLGIDVNLMKRKLILLTALGVGVSTALAGTIAFVGLIVPHVVRLLIGPDHRSLLPASALLGAILLVTADTLARIVINPAELPVGIITAFLGVPFFLTLLVQQRRSHA